MDRDTNYVAVGAFVLLVIAMAVSFVFWYTDQQDKRTYRRYEIYFPGTVSGLTPGSPVRYLGVDVGKVVRISLEPQQRKRVQVLADIESAAPIERPHAGDLDAAGRHRPAVHRFGAGSATPAIRALLAQGHHYPVIRSAPSDFDVLLSSLPALATHPIELVDRFNRVFSDENVRAFKATLDNARAASERLPEHLARRAGSWWPTCGALRTKWRARRPICAR